MKAALILGGALCCALSNFGFAQGSKTEFVARFATSSKSIDWQKAEARNLPRTKRSAHARKPQGANTTLASWYGGGEKLARLTASGEVFRPDGLTAAHRSLPLGSRIAVSANGRTVTVRVNDRGPAKWTGRSLDLSKGAARALGIVGRGTARVTWRAA